MGSARVITRSCPSGHMPFLGVSSLDLGHPSGWPFFVQYAVKARTRRASKAELRLRHSLAVAISAWRSASREGRVPPPSRPQTRRVAARDSLGFRWAVRRAGGGLVPAGTGRHPNRHQSGGRKSERQRIERCRAPGKLGCESGQEDDAEADHGPVMRRDAPTVQILAHGRHPEDSGDVPRRRATDPERYGHTRPPTRSLSGSRGLRHASVLLGRREGRGSPRLTKPI